MCINTVLTWFNLEISNFLFTKLRHSINLEHSVLKSPFKIILEKSRLLKQKIGKSISEPSLKFP